MTQRTEGLKNGMRFSLLIHGVLFILLCGGLKGCGKGGGNSNVPSPQQSEGFPPEKKQEILDKPIYVELKEIPKQKVEEDPDAISNKPKYTKRECGENEWYGGIGVEMIWLQVGAMVDHVYKGYPADKGGLQEGDKLVNSRDFRGEPGTHVTVKYIKQGETEIRSVDMIREKICIRKTVSP